MLHLSVPACAVSACLAVLSVLVPIDVESTVTNQVVSVMGQCCDIRCLVYSLSSVESET